MKKKSIIIIFSVLFFINVFAGDIYTIASFNALHLGWKGKNYEELAEIVSLFDIVGIEEVMKKDGLKKLTKELERQTGDKWRWHISKYSVGRSQKYREYYGYVWQEKKVSLLKANGFYPDEKDEFIREPYGATFKIGSLELTVVLAHLIYGEHKTDRQLEALDLSKVYDYFKKQNKKVIIAGDFNLPAYDDSFKKLFAHKDNIFYAIDPSRNKTTIGKNGLSSSYDNIFYSYKNFKEYTGRSGTYDFTKNKEYDKKYKKDKYKILRKTVSDHLPIYIEVEVDNK